MLGRESAFERWNKLAWGEGGCRERYDSNGFCFALSLEIEMAKKGIFNDI